MIEFEWLWMFLVLPLPLIVRYLMRPETGTGDAALRTPFYADFEDLSAPQAGRFNSIWALLLAILAWMLLVCAAARPQWEMQR